MRKLYLLFFLLFLTHPIWAQDNNSNQPLIDAVAAFNASPGNFDPKVLISNFDKLAQNNIGSFQWVPAYYLSLIYARLSLKNKANADDYADKAINWANTSIAIQANDENYCALSMAKTAKMAVNPFLRWVRYEKSIYAPLQIAKNTNPNNPRIYVLEGSLLAKMPSMFGGGCDKAKPILKKAQALLEKQTPQKLLPIWGMQTLNELRTSCSF